MHGTIPIVLDGGLRIELIVDWLWSKKWRGTIEDIIILWYMTLLAGDDTVINGISTIHFNLSAMLHSTREEIMQSQL